MIGIYCTLFQVLGGEKDEVKIVFGSWAEQTENVNGWFLEGLSFLPFFCCYPCPGNSYEQSCCHHPSKTTTATLLKEIRL